MEMLMLFGLLVGFLIPMQAGINAQLSQALGNPILASVCSFSVGALSLFLYVQCLQPVWPSWELISKMPSWLWLGGVLGAVFVTASIILAPRLGAANLIAIGVAGQMIASMALDHHGWLGFPVHPFSVFRFLGMVLIIGGVLLIQRF